eukprot:m.171196 g.171196  ORF g.171196 m.171196 type:complete len:662 (+) comp13495_c2_seq7:157-2142(+)
MMKEGCCVSHHEDEEQSYHDENIEEKMNNNCKDDVEEGKIGKYIINPIQTTLVNIIIFIFNIFVRWFLWLKQTKQSLVEYGLHALSFPTTPTESTASNLYNNIRINKNFDINDFGIGDEDVIDDRNNESRCNSRGNNGSEGRGTKGMGAVVAVPLGIAKDMLEALKEISGFWMRKGANTLSPRALKKGRLLHAMKMAPTYEEWVKHAAEIDTLVGNDRWKMAFESKNYNYMLLRDHLDAMCQARKKGDLSQMAWLLRRSLHRNIANMGNPKLYEKCFTGTKFLIDQYVDEVVYQLNFVANSDIPNTTHKEKVLIFKKIQQSFGRSALMLSGGGGMGIHHLGVIRTLHDAGMLPRIICGSSVGSLIASGICTTPDHELSDILSGRKPILKNNQVLARDDHPETAWTRLHRLITEGTLADVTILRDCLQDNLGDITFLEAYRKTGRIFNITINARDSGEPPRLLNYLTAPDVVIWSASCASCALTGLFDPVEIFVKTPKGELEAWNPGGMKWSDGSVETDLPMDRLRELFNVNHFIVSQVNPHVVPFIRYKSILSANAFQWLKGEVVYRLQQLQLFGLKRHNISNLITVLNQPYAGDITITPRFTTKDYTSIMANPTEERLRDAIVKGQQCTWPKMNIILNHCRIEFALDEILQQLHECNEFI